MLELLQKGGPLMWLILAASITAMGVFAERLFFLHRASIHTGDFLRGLANLLKSKNFSEAVQECAGTPGPIPRVLHSILLKHGSPRAELREIAQEAGQLEVPRLEQNLGLLGTIAYATPLIGLLGTILGLLSAFQQITAHGGYSTAAEISGGVYQSLLTSAAALTVAIPAFVGHSYLTSRVNDVIHDIERAAIELLEILDTPSAPPDRQ
jgi:biopolymer transport protein ExbB